MADFNISLSIGCDHAGYQMKEFLKSIFDTEGYTFKDYGTFSEESVDYPDFIHPLAREINEGKMSMGIIICGSGNGVSMVANKYPNVRAAVCWNAAIAELSRKHNDANIIALPARFITFDEAVTIVQSFLTTVFEGGRHQRRVDKISGKQ